MVQSGCIAPLILSLQRRICPPVHGCRSASLYIKASKPKHGSDKVTHLPQRAGKFSMVACKRNPSIATVPFPSRLWYGICHNGETFTGSVMESAACFQERTGTLNSCMCFCIMIYLCMPVRTLVFPCPCSSCSIYLKACCLIGVCLRLCMHVFACVLSLSVCVCVCVCACVCICTCTCMCVLRLCSKDISMQYLYFCVIFVRVCIHVCMHATCMRACSMFAHNWLKNVHLHVCAQLDQQCREVGPCVYMYTHKHTMVT